ncbi:transcriptional regulator [Erwinia psidii]|uniref:Transcriptional regulator n=2 Tax=Erwinia psidii TaxID=69224 RepID=A0A3N6TMZ6_9GAMM|nr:transcriptional regulator [Erwinia psidii]MCX8963028.1 transcriptional regulator [Erwinia psidii]MCX8965897.1 transcriptional regulator [Erwinia psidii]RQM36602.1 transcriptional regulator [Erwinia psidii]
MFSVIKSSEQLIDLIAPYAENSEPDEISRGKRRYKFYKNGTRVVYLLLEGDFCLKIKGNNKILNILSAPYIIGFIPSSQEVPLYLERVDYGKVKHIDYDTFWRLVNENNMIDEAMNVISAQYADVVEMISLNKSTSSEEVRSLVRRWQQIPPHLQKRFSVMYLIENSSDLSKSSISRVLKEMKESGEISLDRGRFD